MAAKKQSEPAGISYNEVMRALKAGRLAPAYLFFGEESYLKAHALGAFRRALCGGMEAFNAVVFEGAGLSLGDFEDALLTPPLGGRKCVVVRDLNWDAADAALREALPGLLAAIPEDVCLIFYYDILPYQKPDGRTKIGKALSRALEDSVRFVNFARQSAGELTDWIRRRMAGRGKTIEPPECERLMFLCGYTMQRLAGECDKIAAGTVGQRVTRDDVEALASRVAEARVFDISDAVAAGDYRRALSVMRDLLDAREAAPMFIWSLVSGQFNRLYGAKLLLGARKTEQDIMKLFKLGHPYPAKLLAQNARRLSLPFLRAAQDICLRCDIRMKANLPEDYAMTFALLSLAGEARR
jgi:DNA polymerase-3 subunit delta